MKTSINHLRKYSVNLATPGTLLLQMSGPFVCQVRKWMILPKCSHIVLSHSQVLQWPPCNQGDRRKGSGEEFRPHVWHSMPWRRKQSSWSPWNWLWSQCNPATDTVQQIRKFYSQNFNLHNHNHNGPSPGNESTAVILTTCGQHHSHSFWQCKSCCHWLISPKKHLPFT